MREGGPNLRSNHKVNIQNEELWLQRSTLPQSSGVELSTQTSF